MGALLGQFLVTDRQLLLPGLGLLQSGGGRLGALLKGGDALVEGRFLLAGSLGESLALLLLSLEGLLSPCDLLAGLAGGRLGVPDLFLEFLFARLAALFEGGVLAGLSAQFALGLAQFGLRQLRLNAEFLNLGLQLGLFLAAGCIQWRDIEENALAAGTRPIGLTGGRVARVLGGGWGLARLLTLEFELLDLLEQRPLGGVALLTQ